LLFMRSGQRDLKNFSIFYYIYIFTLELSNRAKSLDMVYHPHILLSSIISPSINIV